MRLLRYAMNVSLDGYVATPDGDLGWASVDDELFRWWSDRVAGTGTTLYGRRLWEAMAGHWPTADRQPGVTPLHAEYARRWRAVPKVVFSTTTAPLDGDARLVAGDAVAEMARLKEEDGGPLDVGGATLAAAAVRAGLVDEYVLVTHPVLLGGGTPFFPAPGVRADLDLVETRPFPGGVLLTRYATRR